MTDPFSGLPSWVKIISVLGAPTFFSCVFLAVFLGWVRSPLTDVLLGQEREQALVAEALKQAALDREQNLAMVAYQNILLRTICRNMVAKQDQAQCEPHYRGYEEK